MLATGSLSCPRAASLNSVDLDVDTAALENLHTASTYTALTALVNDLTRAGEQTPEQQWVLVLDDYHAIASSEVHVRNRSA